MKKTSYIGKTRQDLLKALYAKRDELRDIRFGGAGAKTKNTRSAHSAKKDIARIMTELSKTK